MNQWFEIDYIMGKPENGSDNHVKSCYYAVVYDVEKNGNNHSIDKKKTAASRNRPGLIKVCQAARANLTLFNVQRSVSHGHQKGLHFLNSLLNSLFILLHWNKWGGRTAVRYNWPLSMMFFCPFSKGSFEELRFGFQWVVMEWYCQTLSSSSWPNSVCLSHKLIFRLVHSSVMYEVKTSLESFTSGEKEEGGDNSVRGGRGVPGDQH